MVNKTEFYQSFIRGPSPFVGQLLEQFSDELEYKKYPAKKNLFIDINGQSHCYFLRSGIVEYLVRFPEDHLLTISEAPNIYGIYLAYKNYNVLIRTTVECEIAMLPYDRFMELVSKKGLWELYARHLQVIMNILYQYAQRLSEPSSYSILRSQLYELISEPEVIRESTTAERYIRDKTRLSRSGVLNILAGLKAGGYIVLDKGVLKEVKKLPEKY